MTDKRRGIWVEDWMAEVTDHERLFALLFNLCVQNKSAQIELGNAYIAERLHTTERTIRRWVADMIDEGCILVDVSRGRGARNTYILNRTGLSDFLDEKTMQILFKENRTDMSDFNEEKIGQDVTKNRTANRTGLSDFSSLPQTPSIDKKKENNKKSIKTKKSPQKKVFSDILEDGQNFEIEKEKINLFRDDETARAIAPEVKKSFGEFWRKFAPVEKEQKKYKRALIQWNEMSETWRNACLEMLDKIGKPQEPNPYFYLQHFAPVFLDERQQYAAWKQHVQLCRVRYEDKQPICSAWMAHIFGLTVLDDHYEKKFEI